MSTLARLKYTVARTVASLASLQTKLQNVILPFDDLKNLGLSVIADSTAIVGNTVERTIDISLLPIFKAFNLFNSIPALESSAYRGSIVSSSPEDSATGSGIRSVKITYLILGGIAVMQESITATLNGTTPVDLIDQGRIHNITNIVPITTGAAGTNVGLISVYTETGATAGLVNAQFPANFQGSILSTSPDDKVAGIGAQQITITYEDKLGGGPFVEIVNLNGNTPVNLTNLDHFKILNMTLFAVGATTSSLGVITIMSGLNGTGGPVARLEQSFLAYFPASTDITIPFVELYEQIIANKMTSVVVSAPVLIL